MERNHIILAEDSDNPNVMGRYGPESTIVPVAISLNVDDISGLSYSYDQPTDLRTIS